ncbi:uncharacterized protein [Diadema setosum]|uniref:uncharacterized protein n=1 Tax=Diadema setosum TaxID=31175 RepID=UPI003B3B7182
MTDSQRRKLPALNSVDKRKLMGHVRDVNEVLDTIDTTCITDTDALLYAAAKVVTEDLGFKVHSKQKVNKTEPWWKRRLEGQITEMRAAISKLTESEKRHCKKIRGLSQIEKRYNVKEKGRTVVIEELKQRVTAKAAKVKRYQQRVTQFRQNKLFKTNQERLYEELSGTRNPQEEHPDPVECQQFWGKIWGNPVEHNKDAQWLKDVKRQLKHVEKQENIFIDTQKVKKQLSKMPNWKAAGPDAVHGFWIKHFTAVHERIAKQLQLALESGEVPHWMTTGRTVLIMKDKSKGNVASNYRPITCLNMMWKLMTGIIANEMYCFIERKDLFPVEQKGGRRGCRGTKDQLLIDKMVMRNSKRRRTNLCVAWIDYKKAYDMVPHSWIDECLQMFGLADNIRALLTNSMKAWCTTLTSNGKDLGQVRIQRGIFQGDSLSPLLFVISLIPLTSVLRNVSAGYDLGGNHGSLNHLLFMDDLKLFCKDEKQCDKLVQTVRLVSKDIGMDFGINKCATLVMKRGRRVKTLNTWAVAVLRYTGGVVEWTKAELAGMDRKTRKMLSIYKTHQMSADVDRLYLPRKEGGRGLVSASDCVEMEQISLNNYINSSEEKLLRAVLVESGNNVNAIDPLTFKSQKRTERSAKWREKQLHGQFCRETENISSNDTWLWLKKGELKKETEGLIIAAQEQALAVNKCSESQDTEERCGCHMQDMPRKRRDSATYRMWL